MKNLMRIVTALSVLCTCLIAGASYVHAGTGIYIGKDASADGTTIIGVAPEDSFGAAIVPVIVEKGLYKKGDVIECQNGFKYTLPDDSGKVTLEQYMSYLGFGQWNCSAMNEYGVSVVAAIATNPCEDAIAADPLVEDGVGDEKLPLILAATSQNAEEAVKLLCSLYDEYGSNGALITFIADQEGAWVVESFTGHEYAAVKLPSDMAGSYSHEPVIRTISADDKDAICSPNLLSLPVDNGFAQYDDNNDIDLVATYSANDGFAKESHIREMIGHFMFAPSENVAFDPEKGIDVFFTPDEKISMDQVFEFFRSRYEGTDYDLETNENKENYWGINNQTAVNAHVFQIFDGVPAAMSTVMWATPANPTASPFIPVAGIADAIPECYSTDAEELSFDKDILQFDLAKLCSKVYPRRNLFGRSIRQYWEDIEKSGTKDIAELVTGQWKDAYALSEADAATAANDHLAEVVALVEDDCHRISNEFDAYIFTNGVWRPEIPDSEIKPFECSFDAARIAAENGWETAIEGDVFTATKDGKTIEVVFDGDDKGSVTFIGFDEEELPAEEAAADTEDPAEEPAEVEEATATEETAEVEEAAPAEEPAEEPAKEEPAEEPEQEEAADEVAELEQEAGKQLEVDTIAELESYFVEKISNVPRNGWAENEIAGEFGEISNDVVSIIGKHFTGDIEELLNLNEAKAMEIASDPDLSAVGEKIAEAGVDLSGLLENYFTAAAEDVTGDVINGRLTQDGAVKILNETAAEVEGIARLYIEGISGAFSEVFNTDLSPEEYAEIFAELGEGTLDALDDYDVIDRDALGLGDVDLTDLTDADIEVVITLNEMDDDVINGLSDLLGVDVRATLDMYMDALEGTGVKIENHEIEAANEAPEEQIAALQELEMTLSEEDIEIPQEVIDILTEAINEAAAEDAGEEEADDAGEPAEPEVTESVTVSGVAVSYSDGKVLLPASMLAYFAQR